MVALPGADVKIWRVVREPYPAPDLAPDISARALKYQKEFRKMRKTPRSDFGLNFERGYNNFEYKTRWYGLRVRVPRFLQLYVIDSEFMPKQAIC